MLQGILNWESQPESRRGAAGWKDGAANLNGDELSLGGRLPSLKPRIVCTLHPLEITRGLKMKPHSAIGSLEAVFLSQMMIMPRSVNLGFRLRILPSFWSKVDGVGKYVCRSLYIQEVWTSVSPMYHIMFMGNVGLNWVFDPDLSWFL